MDEVMGITRRYRIIGVVLTFSIYQVAWAQVQSVNRSTARFGAFGDIPIKCRTPLVIWFYSRLNEFPAEIQSQFKTQIPRPSTQKVRNSPAGFFAIHYDTTGPHTPALLDTSNPPQRIPGTHEAFVDSAAKVFDYCWTFEVDTLGFDAPPNDGTRGGDGRYDIYIQALGQGGFGETDWEATDLISSVPNERYYTFILIDNDFADLRTTGMGALKVTAAHELHHAIQVGAYGLWPQVPNQDAYFLELTSSWMEEVVFTSVNDYYNDVRRYFENFKDKFNRSLAFTYFPSNFTDPPFLGYERSIWAIFLAQRFGRAVMREIWREERNQPLFPSMMVVLARHGSSIESEYTLFNYWNFFTADRADPYRFYPEGQAYPRFVPNAAADYAGTTTVLANGAFPFSSQFYEIRFGSDTVTTIVSNVETEAVLRNDNSARNLQLRITSGSPVGPYQTFANGLKYSLVVDRLPAWRTSYLSSLSKSDIARVQTEAVPNPLRLSEATNLMLPVNESASTEAEIFILSSSLDLVFSDHYRVAESYGNRYVFVPVQNLQSKVGSGIYFVIARVADSEYRWKVAIIQ
jgi:hypothetical protein